MKITTNSLSDTFQNVGQIITPSWLSALIAIISGLIVSGGVVVALNYTNGSFQQQLTTLQTTTQPKLSQPGDPQIVPNSSLQQNIPILVLYAFIGLAIYYVALAIVGFFQEVVELKDELDYVHAKPKQEISEFVERLVIRLVTIVGWLLFTEIFVKRILPYSLSAAHASADDFVSVMGVEFLVVAFGLVAVSMQIHASFLRVTLGRVRVFSK